MTQSPEEGLAQVAKVVPDKETMEALARGFYTYKYKEDERSSMGLAACYDATMDTDAVYRYCIAKKCRWLFIGVGFFDTPAGCSYQTWVRILTQTPVKGDSVLLEGSVKCLHHVLAEENPRYMKDVLIIAKPYPGPDYIPIDDAMMAIALNDGRLSVNDLIGFYDKKWK